MMTMSSPATTSRFSDEKSASAFEALGGGEDSRRGPFSLRSLRRPRSGFTEKSRLSYFGPPTAPRSTASTACARAMVRLGKRRSVGRH